MKYPDTCLMIFCKAPQPGQVKTRLIPELGMDAATDLHRRLALLNIERATASRLCAVELWCSPSIDHIFFKYCQDRYDVLLKPQQGRDLGERMAHAFKQVFSKSTYVIVIGTDCPMIGNNYLQQAIEYLHQGTDMVIGAAEDGGYVLLGLAKYNENIFNNITWGSSDVLMQTCQTATAQGLIIKNLPLCWDVDRPEDVARLNSEAIGLPAVDG
jgi:hypothetical protein